MIEDWIDNLAKRWEISDGKGGTVRSYQVFERNEFPETITDPPCVLTIPKRVVYKYSSGSQYALHYGISEFHLTLDAKKERLPEMIRYYHRILVAAAGDVTLGGLVEYFMLSQEEGEGSLIGPAELKYGGEEPHWGIVANWIVKESLSITVA